MTWRGNPALEKARDKGRIDPLQACVIACGLGAIVSKRKASRRRCVLWWSDKMGSHRGSKHASSISSPALWAAYSP